MSNLVDNTSDNDLNNLEINYKQHLADLKKYYPRYKFHNHHLEDSTPGNITERGYNTADSNLTSKILLLKTAADNLDNKTADIYSSIKPLQSDKDNVTKKDELTSEQMISDKVDIYNFHKLNIFIRAIGIAGLLFLFKLKFKGTLKNPLSSSNSMSNNSK